MNKKAVDAAEKLFVSRGFDHVTMEDIANEAGLDQGSVSRYFPDKESMLFAAILPAIRISHAMYVNCSESRMGGLDKVESMCRGHVKFARDNPDCLVLLRQTAPGQYINTKYEDAKEIDRLIHENLALMYNAIEQGVQDRTIRNDISPMEMAAYLILAGMSVTAPDHGWKTTLEAVGISEDQFMTDFHHFIKPAIAGHRLQNEMRCLYVK